MNISPAITDALGSALLQLQKHAPVILTTAGIAGVVTAGVLAAKATLKLEDTVDRAEDRLKHAKGTQQSQVKAVAINTASIVKLYGPSVTLGVVSLVCIVSAQNILHKRNLGIALAYKGLEETYNRYRERVVESYGEEVDRDFHLGLRTEEVTDEKGKKHKVKVLTENASYGGTTFLFGPGNVNWQGTHEFNEFFLNTQQNVLNDLLNFRGHVTVNEVLDKLGMERTKDGFVTGWIKKNPKGDGWIDFRAQLLDSPMAKELEYPDRGTWILDLNIDGLIWDQI